MILTKQFYFKQAFYSRLLIVCTWCLSCIFLGMGPASPEREILMNSSCAELFPATGNLQAAIYDPIDGGTCWSCPKGYTRTAASVKATNSCVRYARADQIGRYGCSNKYGRGAFFDPRNGGECWTCPGGYKRTLEAVTSSKACAKDLIFGPFSRATRKGSDGCNSGIADPISGGTCWTCPSGTERTVFPVHEGKACEGIARAQLRSPTNLGLQPLAAEASSHVEQVTQDLVNTGKEVIANIEKVHQLVNGEYGNYFLRGQFERDIENGNYYAIWQRIEPEVKPLLDQVLEQIRTLEHFKEFGAITLGVSGSAGVIGGVTTSTGLVIIFDGPEVQFRGYSEMGGTIGTSAGVSSGVSVGFWRIDSGDEYPFDCGSGFSVSLGFGFDTPAQPLGIGIAGGIAIDPHLPCQGNWEKLLTMEGIDGIFIDMSVSAGPEKWPNVDVDAAFTTQIVWEAGSSGPFSSCSECGGPGKRPCSLLEAYPSCRDGLIERCDVCAR